MRDQVAKFARRIAGEIIDPTSLEAYVAGRLIPLNKNPGGEEIQVRPIGVGEVLRRIVGKAISYVLKEMTFKTQPVLFKSQQLSKGEPRLQYMQ